jgi:hypothetical protein
MNWKGCGRKWLWPDLRYQLGICLEGVRNVMESSVRVVSDLAEI